MANKEIDPKKAGILLGIGAIAGAAATKILAEKDTRQRLSDQINKTANTARAEIEGKISSIKDRMGNPILGEPIQEELKI